MKGTGHLTVNLLHQCGRSHPFCGVVMALMVLYQAVIDEVHIFYGFTHQT